MAIRPRSGPALGSVVVLLAAGGAPLAAAPAWTVDPAASRLEFETRQGAQTVTGRFGRWSATVRFDPADLAGSVVEVVVDLASIATGDPARDKQALSAEFFDIARSPQARYRTTAFRAESADTYTVEAELALKAATRPLRHRARIRIDGAHASASGEVRLLRREFGFGQGVFDSEQILAAEILVRFEVAASRP